MSRYFQKITGLADVSGPAADLLPEDEALGFIPDWAILLDPSYLSADATGGIYNRVNNSLMRNRASEAGAFAAVPLGTLSGQQAFAPSATAPMTVTSPVAINSERWSFFTVGQYEVSSNAQHLAERWLRKSEQPG